MALVLSIEIVICVSVGVSAVTRIPRNTAALVTTGEHLPTVRSYVLYVFGDQEYTSLISTLQISSSLTSCWSFYLSNVLNPTVHYTTAPSFIQFTHFTGAVLLNFILNGCVWISGV